MSYKVQYEDNTGANTSVMEFNTREEAEAEIEKQLDEVKEYFRGRDYDYGDFVDHNGIAYTEIWDSDSGEYARWYRYPANEEYELMKYVIKLKKVIEKKVVVNAESDVMADKLLREGKYEFAAERVLTRDDYIGYEYIPCDEEETNTAITCEQDLKDYYGTDDIGRMLFKCTDCGCSYLATDDYVIVAGYAENSGDAECPEHRLYFPFTIEEWDAELDEADREACELWKEYNEDEWDDEEECD